MDIQDEPQLPSPRRTQRRQSFNSSTSRFTPQSSVSTEFSGSLLQYGNPGRREDDHGGRGLGRSESLLQERILERKAALRSDRRLSIEADRAIQSSPMRKSTNRRIDERDQRRPTSSGKGAAPTGKKGMGIKDMEEANNNLHKQNFDLKLELFHRRQRQTVLEEQLEAAESRLVEHEELQHVNEELLAELEKRDQAVEEAVGIICSLEERIDQLIQERNIVRQFDAHYDAATNCQASTTKDTYIPSSPPRFGHSPNEALEKLKSSQRAVARMPSFLSDQEEGAEALRSLYLPAERGVSILSLPKPYNSEQDEEAQPDTMSSPRLSVLSESSFLSIYGEKTLPLEALDLDAGALNHDRRHHRKSSSVEKWVEERGKTSVSPRLGSQPHGNTSPVNRNKRLLSINAVLESPLQRLEKLENQVNRANAVAASTQARLTPTIRKTKHFNPNASYHSNVLPPTPDTISSSTLDLYKKSTSTLGRDASPQQSQSRSSENRSREPTSQISREEFSARPHSANEMIKSHREGAGWDTSVSATSTIADDDTIMSYDPWLATAREDHGLNQQPQERDLAREMFESKQKRLEAPDMFSFSAIEPIVTEDALGIYDDDDQDGWERDMMFNHNEDGVIDLPRMTRHLQRLGIGEEPHSDDTILPNRRVQRRNESSTVESSRGLATDSTNPPPQPRRSSLGTSSHPRKFRRGSTSASTTVQNHLLANKTAVNSSAMLTAARARIATKLFGRSESYPQQRPSSSSGHSRDKSVADKLTSSSTSPSVALIDNAGVSASPRRRQGGLPRSQTCSELPASRPRQDIQTQASASARRGHQKNLSVGFETLPVLSATPPPISRYPRSGAGTTGKPVGIIVHPANRRPSSAGNGSATTGAGARFGKIAALGGRRRDSQIGVEEYYGKASAGMDWGSDGVKGEKEKRPVTQGTVGLTTSNTGETGGLKKWLGGLARHGSIKKGV